MTVLGIQNFPNNAPEDSSKLVKSFFDRYFQHQITFPTNQIDVVVGHFLKRGFDENAAKSTAIVLLTQSRIENVNVFQLIDTLNGLSDQALTLVIAEILNIYREKTSYLGFKSEIIADNYESRNIRQ
jgi:hypothetical protein